MGSFAWPSAYAHRYNVYEYAEEQRLQDVLVLVDADADAVAGSRSDEQIQRSVPGELRGGLVVVFVAGSGFSQSSERG